MVTFEIVTFEQPDVTLLNWQPYNRFRRKNAMDARAAVSKYWQRISRNPRIVVNRVG